MILLFSEAEADYSRYQYSYVIWAAPEPGETPADFFRRGFLPSSPQLDRFYLCRNLRVNLREFELSSENRRILRKGEGIQMKLIPRQKFDYSEARRRNWKNFADQRFGEEVMSFERLDQLMTAPVISHLLHFEDSESHEDVGTALLYAEKPRVAFYYYAFYNLESRSRNPGMFMMTSAVEWFADQGFEHLHLGTCYSERALYKTQFAGTEFFNGFRWSGNLEELKFLLQRDQQAAPRHLLSMPEYCEAFYPQALPAIAKASLFNCQRPE